MHLQKTVYTAERWKLWQYMRNFAKRCRKQWKAGRTAVKRKNNPILKSIRLWITPPHEEGGDLQAV